MMPRRKRYRFNLEQTSFSSIRMPVVSMQEVVSQSVEPVGRCASSRKVNVYPGKFTQVFSSTWSLPHSRELKAHEYGKDANIAGVFAWEQCYAAICIGEC